MATKPSSLPRWAHNGTTATTAAIVEPASSKKTSGFAEGEEPTAEEVNWLFELAYEWAAYLNDGALTGNHSIAGDLALTGTGTLTAVDAVISDDLSVGGDVDFTGADTIKLPSFSKFIPSVGIGYLYSGTATQGGSYWSGGTVGQVSIPIVLPVGFRIKSIKARYRRGAGTLTFQLFDLNYDTLSAALATLTDNTGTTDEEASLVGTVSGTTTIDHTIVADRCYIVRASIGDVSDRFYGVVVTYDKPT